MTKTVVISGPTASGKTALSVSLAERFNGEIVSADSMQIYRKMSVATAKPTPEEMKNVPHHLIDFLEPSEPFSVADYVKLARAAVEDIASRQRLPMVCGGTGLYIDSLLQDITFADEPSDPSVRRSLEAELSERGGEYMLKLLSDIDPETASRLHPNNQKRIIRALEVYRLTGKTFSELSRLSREGADPLCALKICLDYRDRETLYRRIDKRVDEMFDRGLVDEAKYILSLDLKTSSQAIGYKELKPYFSGDLTLAECAENLKRSTRRYAKRQLTWFRRDKTAVWLYPDDYADFEDQCAAASRLIENFLKEQ